MANFVFDISQLERGLNVYEHRLDAATIAVMEVFAEAMEDRAQTGHVWQNRSGDAEAGLKGGIEYDDARHIVTLYLEHDPDLNYPWYLETYFGGRFATIVPILESTYEPLMAALRRMLG